MAKSNRMVAALQAAVTWMRTELEATDVALTLALVLLVAGFWSWWRPGAYLAPAAVLLWVFLPSRYHFIVSPPAPAKRNGRES